MSRFILATVFAALSVFWAVPAFCEGPLLWQDPGSGQLFIKPADGRVPVDPVKDLQLPEQALGGLYEDEQGAVYIKPGAGRTRVVFGAPARPSTTVAQSSPAPADYSTQAFADAVKNVIGEKEAGTYPKVKVGGLFYGEYFLISRKGFRTVNTGRTGAEGTSSVLTGAI